MTTQDIRVRLDGTAGEGDIGALHSWLEQESALDELVRADALRIHERQRRDEPGTPMGLSQEIVLVMAASISTVTADALLQQVKQSVEAWRANRRQVENGEPPEGRVERDDHDSRVGRDASEAPVERDDPERR